MLTIKLTILVLIISNVCCRSFSGEGRNKSRRTKTKILPIEFPISTSDEETSTNILHATTIEASSTTDNPATTDNPTTSELPTATAYPIINITVTAIPVTTTEGTRKENLPFCETSLHSKTDLSDIIDYVSCKMNIFHDIILEANASAEYILETHMQDLDLFRQWLENRPEHLEHVLEDFRTSRDMLQLLVDEIDDLFQQYPGLQEKFNEKRNTAGQLIADFEKFNKLCDLNCDQNVVVERSQTLEKKMPYDPKEYYCGSISDIHKEILVKFSDFAVSLINEVNNDFNDRKHTYVQKIDFLKTNIKDQMLQHFGRTMYDVLNLQDEFYHYSQKIKNNNIESVLNNIRNNVAELHAKITTFKIAIQKQGKFCKTCGDELISRTLTRSPTAILADNNGKLISHNILTEQIKAKEEQIISEITRNTIETLKPLEDHLKSSSDINAYNEEIKEIKEKVVHEIEKEKEEFYNLKNNINSLPVSKMLTLEKESSALLKNIKSKIANINDFLEKNNY